MTKNLSEFFSSNAQGSGATPGASLSGFLDQPKKPQAPQQREADVGTIIAQEGADHLKPVIEAIYKQESGAGANARTSIDGAHGGMQIIPATFQRYAKPGERIDNPDDNMRVGVRIIKDLAGKFGNDPAKIATGYFSGEGNVNAGQGSAWKNDRADGNGKRVSGYVSDILAKVGGIGMANAGEMKAPGLPDLSKQPKWRDIENGAKYQKLPDAEKQALKSRYFDELIAPHAKAAGADVQAARQKFMAAQTAVAPDSRSTLETAGDTARNLAAGVLKIGPTALKGVADVANMLTGDTIDLGVSKAMKTGMDAIDETVASQRFNDQKKGFESVMADKTKGIGDMFAYMLDNPAILVDNTITTVGSMFLPAGAAKGAVMGTKALGMGTAAASKAAVAASIGTSAAQNAADTFSTLEKQSLEDRYKGAAISAGVSILTGIATGGGAEGQIAKKMAGDLQAGRIGLDTVKRFLQSVGKEGAQEAGEEVGNIAGEATGSLEAPDPTNAAKRTAFAGTLGAVMGGGTHVATNITGNGQPQAEPVAPDAASLTPDGRIEPTMDGNMAVQPAEEAGAPAIHPTSQTADDIVRELAAEAGVPLETVLPAAPAHGNEARAVQLWMKAGDGTITPDEQAELNGLQQAMAAEAPAVVPSDQSQLATQANEAAPATGPVAQPEAGQQFPATMEPGLLAAQENQSENGQDPQLGAAQHQVASDGIAAEQGAAAIQEPAADSAITQAPVGNAVATQPDATGQQGIDVQPQASVTPAKPRTEKEARALRVMQGAQQQEISNAHQAAQAQQAEAQGSERQQAPAPATEPVAPKTEREAREQRRQTDILTPDGKKVAAQWDVVEADSIKASLKEGVSQPRDRTRAASNAQVLEIAGNPDFDRLSDTSKTMDYGAPTLSADGLIVGGNGRFEGISRAYDGPTATAYRAAVEQQAARFGLDGDAIKGMKKPVLVRRITDNADTRQLAIQSNQAAGLQMSDMEQAALDAERMKSLDHIEISDTGDIPLTSRNMQAIQQTLGGYATNELAGMMTADGGLSQSGMRRLRNAILFSAYGKSDTLARLIESPDADMKNVGTALVRAAGKLAKVHGGVADGSIQAEFDIAGDLTVAIETLSALRAEGKRLDEFLAQGDMFGGGLTDAQKTIIQVLADNLRSAKNITAFLQDYAQQVASIQNSKGGLFGDAPLPTKQEVLDRARKPYQPDNGRASGAQDLFNATAPELHADTTGGHREVQAGESGNRPDARGQSGDEAARKPESGTGADAGSAKPAGVNHADDFAIRPVEITEHLIATGNIKALYKAAGVKTADAFGGLPMDQRSKAYAQYVENGGQPVPPATEAYNDKVARMEREALIRRLQSDATVRQASGKPFKTEASAKEFSTRHELDDTHEVAKVEAGYVLKRLPEARRPSVLKAMAERQANDPENQRQERAFARAGEIGAAASDAVNAYENGDTSIEQFEAALDAAEKVGAGETAANDAVTQADAIAPEQLDVELLPTTPAQAAQAKAQESKIGDMGRKVIVRKDTATPTGPRAKATNTDERPAWIRKYHVMQDKNGKWEIMEDVGSGRRKGMVKRVSYDRYTTEQEAWDALPLVVAAKRHRAYSYTDKTGKQQYGIFRSITDRKRALVKGGFASANEAMEYIAANPVEMIEHKFPFPERPWLDKIERTGKDYRKGKNVTKQMFEDTFAPGAVVYGNWLLNGDDTVNADGQELSNFIYDSLRDLAETIGVPPKALFLNGELALGIGADGKGGKNSAAAHYDPNPGKVLINLTKIKGAGSAAHEWWHAVDHYFARQGGYKDSASVVAGDFPHNSKARPELVEAIKRVVDTMLFSTKSQTTDADVVKAGAQKRVDEAIKNLDYYARDLRSTLKEGRYNKGKKMATEAQLQQWDAMVERLKAGDMGEKVYIDNPSKMRGAMGFETGTVLRDMNALYKSVTGRSFLRQDPESTGRRLHWVVQSIKENLERTTAEQDETRTYKGRTDYYLEAKQIDNYRTGDYWSMPEELGARAFESYIFDKLTGTGSRSDYLVYAVENRHYAALGMKPYPEGGERQAINAAFDKLFETVQTKETDAGVALFSRTPANGNDAVSAVVVDDVTANEIIDRFIANHPGTKGMIKIVPDFAALPANVQQDARDQGSSEKDTKGAFDHRTGTAYIVQGNHTSPVDFEETVFHEMLGHVGIRTLLGRGFVGELQNIFQQLGGLEGLAKIARARGFSKEFGEYVRGVAKARGQNEKYTLAIAKAVLSEEVFAHMAQQKPKLLDRLKALVGMLRQNLRDLGFKRLAQYGETDLLWMLQRAKVKLQTGKADGRGGWTVLKSAYGNGNGGNNSLGLEGGENTPAWDVPPPSRMDKFIYEMQDRQINLKRVQQAIAEVTEIPEQFDAYQKEELYHGRVATRTHKFLDREVRPLLMDMKLKGIGMEELEAYLWARHAKERNAQIAKINPEMAEGGSGLTDAQVDQYLAGADVLDDKGEVIIKGMKQDDRTRLEALAARVDTINAGTKQVLMQYGLESPDTIAAWERTYKNYVPLHREDMEGVTPIGMGFSVKGAASKRAMGSQRKVTDVLAHLALQREAAITRGEKNRVGLALYGLALQNKNAEFWEADKVPMMQHIDDKTGLVTRIPDPTYKNKPNVLVLRVGGQDRAVVFNEHDERAVRAVEVLKNLDVQSFGEIMGTLATATRYLAAINTQYNPVFGLVNGLRDVQAAALNISSTPLSGHTWQVLKSVPSAMRAIWQIERHGKAGNEFDALYEDMQMTGGTTGYREIFRVGADRAKALQQEFNSFDAGKGRKALTAFLELLDHYNTAIENGTRLAAYKAAMANGMSKDKAASVAKNITVNFNRKGKMGREAGAFYAFFNAAVQGTARTLETLKGPMGKKIIMGGVALGVLQALVAAAGFDDDEWEDIPEFLKQRNFIIPTGNHTYLMFPMPLGFNVLPNLGRIPTELALNGGRKIGTRITDLLTVLVDSANPLGSATLAQMIAPTVVDPIVALAENKNFAGFPIAKEDTNPLQPTPGFSRAKDTSSRVARGIAKGINYASGGTKYTPGLLSPTPDQIDYIFGTLTGGAGRELNKVYQTAEMVATGKDVPESKKPVVGRFFGTTDDEIATAARFWTNVKDLNTLEMEIKGRAKDGEDPAAFIQKHPEAGMVRQANRFERQISKMRTERHRIEFDEKITEKERTAQLLEMDANITKAMGDFNAMVRDGKKHKPE